MVSCYLVSCVCYVYVYRQCLAVKLLTEVFFQILFCINVLLSCDLPIENTAETHTVLLLEERE